MSNPYTQRIISQRFIRKVLIVCEGEKTEPNYFKAFQTNEELIKVNIVGEGRNKASLIERAIDLKKDAEIKKEAYASVWCVFDRDTHLGDPQDKNNFIRAIQLAKNNHIKAVYSNDAFELWYVLHFCLHQSAWHRDRYIQELSKRMNSEYRKNDPNIYGKLKDKQKAAIKHSKQLLSQYVPNHKPESDNPCTVVHVLVEFLNAYLADE